jgi:hypothetical protein
MKVLLQALEIVFEVQMKRSNKKTRNEISFPTYKTHFFPFFFFGPLQLSKFI